MFQSFYSVAEKTMSEKCVCAATIGIATKSYCEHSCLSNDTLELQVFTMEHGSHHLSTGVVGEAKQSGVGSNETGFHLVHWHAVSSIILQSSLCRWVVLRHANYDVLERVNCKTRSR